MRYMSRLWVAPLLLTVMTAGANAQVFEGSVNGGSSNLLNNGNLAAGYSLDDGWEFSIPYHFEQLESFRTRVRIRIQPYKKSTFQWSGPGRNGHSPGVL